MKDYKIPMAVAVPAALGLVGILWILRRKSGSGGEDRKRRESGPKVEVQVDESCTAQPCLVSEKEGITITQRKIPETQARDRGSSDLPDEFAPDVTAGKTAGDDTLTTTTNSSTTNDGRLANSKLSHLLTGHNGQGDGLSMGERRQVEHIVTTAMGDGLHEARVKLTQTATLSHDQTGEKTRDSDSASGAVCSERLEGTKVVEEVSIQQHGSVQAQSRSTSLEVLETGAQCQVPSARGQRVTAGTDIGPQLVKSNVPPSHTCDTPAKTSASSVSHSADHIQHTEQQLSSSAPCPQPASVHSQPSSDLLTSSSGSVASLPPQTTSDGVVCQQSSETTTTISGVKQNMYKPAQLASVRRLPTELVRALSSPLTKLPLVSTSSIDSVSSLGPEEIWGLKSCDLSLEGSLDTMTSVSSLDPFSSTNPSLDSSNNSHSKVSDVAGVSSGVSVLDSGGAASQAVGGDNKEDSPAKSSSPVCDNNSEGSNDSGRGGSDHDAGGQVTDAIVHFDFNMPSDLCGRFIGKQGKNINYMKSKSGASISLTNNPFTAQYQICQVVGTQTEVDEALYLIRRKFPLQDYPLLTMVPINLSSPSTPPEHPVIVPDIMQLSLPEGVSVEVYVSAIVDAGQVFVQQPTHPSFMSLEKLNYFLNTVYAQDAGVPCVPTPVEAGVICVCENEGFWYRAMIMSPEDENGEAQIKFVDYGGYAQMPVTALKQIRTDFMSLPFQAVECFMANITPNQDEQYFSEEATVALSEMTQNKLLQCQVVARMDNSIPYIHLYQISPESNSAVMINRALVNSRLVRWIEIL